MFALVLGAVAGLLASLFELLLLEEFEDVPVLFPPQPVNPTVNRPNTTSKAKRPHRLNVMPYPHFLDCVNTCSARSRDLLIEISLSGLYMKYRSFLMSNLLKVGNPEEIVAWTRVFD